MTSKVTNYDLVAGDAYEIARYNLPSSTGISTHAKKQRFWASGVVPKRN
jgi:hypothetical protein